MSNADAAATTCRLPGDSEQIGCLVSADPCSIGYAGLSAVTAPLNKALSLRTPSTSPLAEVGPTQASILERLGTCPGVGMRYPLARALYINAAKGLANLTNGPTAGNVTGEKDLYQCLVDRTNHITDSAILASELIAIPGTDPYPIRTCQP
jgi:hypothetical protein